MAKRALITGICGQDASYLAEQLLERGDDVYGVYKRVSSGNNFSNIAAIKDHPRLHLIEGDILDAGFMTALIKDVQPGEFYSLAAQSHVGLSFKIPAETIRLDAEAIAIQLDAIKNFSPKTRFYFAATSEMWGGLNCPKTGFDETSPFYPRSPYAAAKACAFYLTRNYREAYDLFACSGILMNHSSVRRGADFATRKITQGIAAVKLGLQKHVLMGDLSAFRDEGSAEDYTRAMQLILAQDRPEDFVVATGVGATIEEMFKHVCGLAELKFEDVYRQDERFMRPSEVRFLLGNSSKIRAIGWKPKHDWRSLLTSMYEHDLATLKKEQV